MSYILASGCSFTNKNWRSYKHPELELWTKWPELIGAEKNIETINLGKNGASNRLILKNASAQIYIRKPKIVLILLTDMSRFSVYGAWNMVFKGHAPQKNVYDTHLRTMFGEFVFEQSSIKDVITEQFIDILNFVNMCKTKKIKVLIGQNHIGPFNLIDWDQTEAIEHYLNNPLFLEMEANKEHFIGWPWLPELGGYQLSSAEHEISGSDHHPTEEGQKFIANHFLRYL